MYGRYGASSLHGQRNKFPSSVDMLWVQELQETYKIYHYHLLLNFSLLHPPTQTIKLRNLIRSVNNELARSTWLDGGHPPDIIYLQALTKQQGVGMVCHCGHLLCISQHREWLKILNSTKAITSHLLLTHLAPKKHLINKNLPIFCPSCGRAGGGGDSVYVQGDPREPDIFWMGSTQNCAEEE